MTIRSKEELVEDDAKAAWLAQVEKDLEPVIKKFEHFVRQYVLDCVRVLGTEGNGAKYACKSLVFAAGKVGPLGDILPPEAKSLYANGYSRGIEMLEAPRVDMDVIKEILDELAPGGVEVFTIDEFLDVVISDEFQDKLKER